VKTMRSIAADTLTLIGREWTVIRYSSFDE
jgi:hypothetical protein